jgi:hypothetical protein
MYSKQKVHLHNEVRENDFSQTVFCTLSTGGGGLILQYHTSFQNHGLRGANATWVHDIKNEQILYETYFNVLKITW